MKKSLIWVLSGAAAVGVIGTGVATWMLLQPAASPTATSDEPTEGIVIDPAEVPALYTGDELEWLIPSDEVLGGLVGAVSFEETLAAYSGTGETEGFGARNQECNPLIWEDFSVVIGQRYRSFSTESGDGGAVRVLQFGSPEAASAWVGPRLDVPDTCATFDVGRFYEGVDEKYNTYSYTLLASASEDDATVVVDRIDVAENGEYDLDTYAGVMLNGNTVTMVSLFFRDDIDIDADAVAAALTAQAASAHQHLVDALR